MELSVIHRGRTPRTKVRL